MKQYDAVIAGYLCVDLTPQFPAGIPNVSVAQQLVPGRLVEIDGLAFALGGVVANTGIAMKKFGKRVLLSGLVGEDFVGNAARQLLKKMHLAGGIQSTDQSATGISIVIAPPGVDRIFLESPGCNSILDVNSMDFDGIANAQLLHFGYPPLLKQFYADSGRQLVELFSRARRLRVATSLDFTLPDPASESGKLDWPAIMARILPETDIFVPSLEEIIRLLFPLKYAEIVSQTGQMEVLDHIPMEMIREVGRQAIRYGAKILLIKAAHRGAFLLTGDVSSINDRSDLKLSDDWNHRELWCDAYSVEKVRLKNANGAGDTAVAAFLSAILNGESPENALKYAGVAGRDNLYCADIFEELTDWRGLQKELEGEPKTVLDAGKSFPSNSASIL
jgi:sugar/nucleoside kinase (ribokinase family)